MNYYTFTVYSFLCVRVINTALPTFELQSRPHAGGALRRREHALQVADAGDVPERPRDAPSAGCPAVRFLDHAAGDLRAAAQRARHPGGDAHAVHVGAVGAVVVLYRNCPRGRNSDRAVFLGYVDLFTVCDGFISTKIPSLDSSLR